MRFAARAGNSPILERTGLLVELDNVFDRQRPAGVLTEISGHNVDHGGLAADRFAVDVKVINA
jgi:hypothetical protein